jgi:hypothetical protein
MGELLKETTNSDLHKLRQEKDLDCHFGETTTAWYMADTACLFRSLARNEKTDSGSGVDSQKIMP